MPNYHLDALGLQIEAQRAVRSPLRRNRRIAIALVKADGF